MFRKVLIANRGEIAVRIKKALTELNISPVVIYDEREKNFPYVKDCEESYSLGTGKVTDTFLNVKKILDIAKKSKCDAVHPGYGFLSENSTFAEACRSQGLVFIGPDPRTITLMGNKLKAREFVSNLNIPVIPVINLKDIEDPDNLDPDLFPCIVKGTEAGGGKGMHLVQTGSDLGNILERASRESGDYFGNSEVYVEKYLHNPMHIEIQILADNNGNTISLYERDCSLQRRFQKIVEEAPAPGLSGQLRSSLSESAISIAKAASYRGVGTVEFLVDSSGNYFFLEMNTRIQVEHGVTEMAYGIDIVKEQIKISSGESLTLKQDEIKPEYHAIEVRLYAEDTDNEFRPSPGKIDLVRFSDNENLRIDSGIESGLEIYSEFDPLMFKIIVWDHNREKAINGMKNVLDNTIIQGIPTNCGLLYNIFCNPVFHKGTYSTQFLSENLVHLNKRGGPDQEIAEMLITTGVYLSLYALPKDNTEHEHSFIKERIGFWRMIPELNIEFQNRPYRILLEESGEEYIRMRINENESELRIEECSRERIDVIFKKEKSSIFYS